MLGNLEQIALEIYCSLDLQSCALDFVWVSVGLRFSVMGNHEQSEIYRKRF